MKALFALTLYLLTSLGAMAFYVGALNYKVVDGSAQITECDWLATTVSIPATVTYEGVAYDVATIAPGVFDFSAIESFCVASDNKSFMTSADGCCLYNGIQLLRVAVTATSVDIAQGTTSIAPFAFNYCRELTNVTIPTTVSEIGEKVFCECAMLKSIEIPSSVKTIGEAAFMSCNSLKSINIPSTVDTIDTNAFYGCRALRSLELPSGIVVANWAFDGCTSLSSVVAHGPVEIGKRTFEDCVSLVTVDMPVSIIPANAFQSCISLTSFNFDNVTQIDGEAFNNCRSLKAIDLPPTVTSLGSRVFWNCKSLKSAKIAGAKIGDSVFLGCDSLTTLELGENVSRVAKAAFSGSGIREVKCYAPTLSHLDEAFPDPQKIVLYVPAAYLETYRNMYSYRFKDILPIEGSSSVGGVATTAPASAAAVKRVDAKGGVVIGRYNALGQRVR